MMRFIVSVLATAAIFLAATAATATISFTVVVTNLNSAASVGNGGNLAAVGGDLIQVDIFMDNDQSFGINAAAFQAYNLGTLSYQNGSSAADWFSKNLLGGTIPNKGLANLAGTGNGTDGSSVNLPRTLSAGNIAQVALVDGTIQFFNGLTVGAASIGTGDFDAGIGGITNVAPHARLVFQAVSGTSNVGVGIGGPSGSGTTDLAAGFTPADVNEALFSVTVVPEPATALLMGLGLGGLSLAGRRRA